MGFAAVALGGGLGSLLRYWMGLAVQQAVGRPFPAGTLAVNVLGSFLIGLLYILLLQKSAAAHWRLFWLAGVLGGFTTFSSFSLETYGLLAEGAYTRAFLNVALSIVLCLAATGLGIFVARQF